MTLNRYLCCVCVTPVGKSPGTSDPRRSFEDALPKGTHFSACPKDVRMIGVHVTTESSALLWSPQLFALYVGNEKESCSIFPSECSPLS